MMNYIWAGLIVAALGFALWFDGTEIATGRYANGNPLPATIEIPATAATSDPRTLVQVSFDADTFAGHFHRSPLSKSERDSLTVAGELTRGSTGYELRLTSDNLPVPLNEIRAFHDDTNKSLRATLRGLPADLQPGGKATRWTVQLELPSVRFVKLKAITKAAFDFANTAVTLAIGLIGVLALWLGMMKIAEASGLIAAFVSIVQPFLRLLFPTIPKDHPALGMIALNLAANMLGLGNAATPMGLKAMEELQKLNKTDDTATDPMVMLLALNTAGVQLLPSATLVAIMGLSSVRLFLPILLVTGLCAVIAFFATRILGALPVFRRTNPDLSQVPTTGG